MLVLSRKKNERIIATTKSGEKIVVSVVDIRGDKVRLGFESDISTAIHREEVQVQVDARAVPAPHTPFGGEVAFTTR